MDRAASGDSLQPTQTAPGSSSTTSYAPASLPSSGYSTSASTYYAPTYDTAGYATSAAGVQGGSTTSYADDGNYANLPVPEFQTPPRPYCPCWNDIYTYNHCTACCEGTAPAEGEQCGTCKVSPQSTILHQPVGGHI